MRLEPPVAPEALAAIRAPFAAAGAVPTDVPVLQPLSLLLDLAGEAMRARLFVVQGEGMSEAALRPDFTIPMARAHLEGGALSGRYLYEGKAFRVAPRGSVRAEEFLQIGVEAFEAGDKAGADAEIAALAWRAAAAGGRSDLSMRLGDVSLFAAFIDSLGPAPATAARLKRAFSRPRMLWAELDQAAREPAETAAPSRLPSLLAGLPEAALGQPGLDLLLQPALGGDGEDQRGLLSAHSTPPATARAGRTMQPTAPTDEVAPSRANRPS